MNLTEFLKSDRRESLKAATDDEIRRWIHEAKGHCVHEFKNKRLWNEVDGRYNWESVCKKCGEGIDQCAPLDDLDESHVLGVLKELILGVGTTIELCELLNTGLEHIGFQVQINARNRSGYVTEYYDADTLERAICEAYLMGLEVDTLLDITNLMGLEGELSNDKGIDNNNFANSKSCPKSWKY